MSRNDRAPFRWPSWVFLGLLALFQLIGWLVYGKKQATDAVSVIIYPSSILIGIFWPWWLKQMKGWRFLPLLLFLFIQGGLFIGPRNAPRDTLMYHAASDFLDYTPPLVEYWLLSGVFNGFIYIVIIFFAFLSAEIIQLYQNRSFGGGIACFKDTWQLFLQEERAIKRGKR